jgi:glutamate 5-kinase
MRFIVKIGTNLLTNEDHSLNTDFIENIAGQVAELKSAGHEAMIVTSGAVAAGRQNLTLKKESKHIPYRQALASIGQTFLLDTYRDAFSKHDIVIGQVLLTMADFERHQNFLSTRNTLELLLEMGVVPIVNENDVTTFDELKFGDNDNLSARVASLINAEKLLFLSDVNGLYDASPKKHPDAKLIPVVEKITPEITKMAVTEHSKVTCGGMEGKLAAAQFATESGVTVIITDGTISNVVKELILDEAEHGTRFERQFTPREARRKWLQTQCLKDASLSVDDGAKTALLEKGKSLLPSGVTEISGDYKRGDVINILDGNGEKIGFGQINYSSDEMAQIKGLQSNEIQAVLGYVLEEVVMHRDNMVT